MSSVKRNEVSSGAGVAQRHCTAQCRTDRSGIWWHGAINIGGCRMKEKGSKELVIRTAFR